MADDFKARMQEQVTAHPIVLFIKGTKTAPQCGFSAAVLSIFQELGKPFETVDVLSNPEVRSRMQEFSNWPTFPQIFIKGQLIGGCDIVSEMHERGELTPIVEQAFRA